MNQSQDSTNVARQVELIIRRLNSLSTLPSIAANFLPQLTEPDLSISSLSKIVEADPALCARVLSLARQQRPEIELVSEAVEKLSPALLREAILSVKVFQVFNSDYDPDKNRPLPRKQLAIHAIAVACAASQLAQEIHTEPQINPQFAFSAGLLHDIGKLAIDEVMPKSYERVVSEAKSLSSGIADIERKYLGLDHCIVGKRLAEKWGLPQQIILAIWLHNSDPDSISQNMPGAHLAQIVRLADNIARASQLGNSGSFNEPEFGPAILNSLDLSSGQIDEIIHNLPQQVSEKTQLLSLNSDGNPALWCRAIQNTAANFAHDNNELASENRQLQISSGLCGFINDFISDVSSTMSAIDIAAVFGSKLKQFYNTGPVCVYLPDSQNKEFAEAVTIDENNKTEYFLLKSPADTQMIPAKIQNSREFFDAYEHVPWLFEQTTVQFDPPLTRITPLSANYFAVGAVIIEFSQPNIAALPNFSAVANSAAILMALANAQQNEKVLSEQFAVTLGKLKETQDQLACAQSLHAVAELAAGAAHELNNPLAVISGRAQLLQEVETDQDKKQMLRQIEQRARDIAEIIEDLMAFARPEPADIEKNSVRSIIEEALQNTAKKHNLSSLETNIENLEALPDIYVDKSQIAAAVSNVLSNSLEAYPGSNGPITISARTLQNNSIVEITIQDRGIGMDPETLRKAMLPFFSAKPAGRKRGMGLAKTQRLLQLNNGTIRLVSQPNFGTSAIITMPGASQ